MDDLRDYQASAIAQLRQGLRDGHRCQMLQLPTGAGKTVIASSLCRSAHAKGRKPYFIVDRIELVGQSVLALERAGLSVGVIQGDHPQWNPHADVQVASIQTLRNRRAPDMDFALIDEAHVLHKAHKALMEKYNAVPFIGLSATPFAPGLGRHFTNLVVGTTTHELTDSGWLVPAVTFAPSTPDLERVCVARGDYATRPLSKVMSKPKLVGDLVESWFKRGEGRPTLVFAVDVAHSQAIAARFVRAGVRAVHIDAYTDSDDRRAIIDSFKAGKVQMLCSVGVLTTGFDAPNASCLVLARPTKSLMLHIQQIGRGLRISPETGKRDCLVLDHAGNTSRLGFATDPLPEELDMGEKRDSAWRKQHERKPESLPKDCPSCKYCKPANVHRCPLCGFAPARPDNVVWVEGELVQVGGEVQRADKPTKQRWYSMLLWYARRHNKSDGWVAHSYREKFGCWPRGLDQAPVKPNLEVRGYIKHKAIRYAKRLEKELRHA